MNNLVATLEKSLEAPAIDPVLLAIANDYVAGEGVQEIAVKYSISADLVSGCLDKPEVKRYVDNVYMSQGFLHRRRRLELINTVIEKKIEEALESGVYSKRDLLEWLNLLQKMETDLKPSKATGETKVAVKVETNYNNLMNDLMATSRNGECHHPTTSVNGKVIDNE